MIKRGRSLLIVVVLPAVVSLAVTLFVLTLWNVQNPQGPRVIELPTHSGTALISPRTTQSPSGGPGEVSGTLEPGTTQLAEQSPGSGCQNSTHVVISGDTLVGIASQYGVSVDDLVTANQAVDPSFNPDVLSVGQELVIPTCGVPSQAPVPTPTDTLVPTRNIPTPIATATEPPPGTTNVKIARVLNIGDITREAVEILNQGSPVDLKGWKLSNGKGQDYVFPAFRLFTAGGVTIYSGVGQDTPINLYWGLTDPLWQVGDTVYLYDADGKPQDHLDITKQ